MLRLKKISFLFSFIILFISMVTLSIADRIFPTTNNPFSETDMESIKQYLFNNITTDERVVVKESDGRIIRSIPGAVLASPTNREKEFSQDYQFHWTRDAALSMKEVATLYEQSPASEKARLKPYLMNYIYFEQKAQKQISHEGETLGQPKFNIDGTIWEGKWGRPQNDGPALRADTLIEIASIFLQEGDNKLVQTILLPMIALDLDYVTSHWKNTNFDLWEEVNDPDHFFTKMVQRKSCIDGAALFKKFNDNERANLYLDTATQLTASLKKHWNTSRGYLTETINQQYFKGGGIDTSIILGVIHGNLDNPNDFFAVSNDRVTSSIYFIRNAFSGLYRINIDHPQLPPLLGRYPNDIYDGNQFIYGNPWILTTSALAQYYYLLAQSLLKQGKITITPYNLLFYQQINPHLVEGEEVILLSENPERFHQITNSLILEGDRILKNIRQYGTCETSTSCNHFAEQLDRTSKMPVSAKNLTWGYASLLTAMQSRSMAMQSLMK